mgnify:CR=1 FL=1
MKSYDKPLIFMLITGFICCFVCFFLAATKQSYADIHSSLYTELESKACQILNELKALPSESETDISNGKTYCLMAYEDYSALFDRADEAYDKGETDNDEYVNILDMLNSIGEELNTEFSRFGFDPYATDLCYGISIKPEKISNYVSKYEWSSYYNGSNIIIHFSFSIGVSDKLWKINVGGGAELLYVDAYGYSHSTSDPVKGARYFRSNFGTVTLNSINMNSRRTVADGYITVTDPSGLRNWINYGDRKLWFQTYSDSGTDYEYYTNGISGMSPTEISGIGTALSQGSCSHNYMFKSIDSSKHQKSCTKCGYVQSTSAHNSSVNDTVSSPGYLIKKCSDCGYIVSTTAVYEKTRYDTAVNEFAVTGIS